MKCRWQTSRWRAGVARWWSQRSISDCALLVGLSVVIGCSDSRPVELVAQLLSPDAEVRAAAAAELGALGSAAETAVPDLVVAVSDVDAQVRQAACRALGEVPAAVDASRPALTGALTDPELPVRMAAALALWKVDPAGELYVPVLTAAMQQGEGGTIVAVGRRGADARWALASLTKLLRDPRPGIRRIAAEALGRIGPNEAARTALERARQDADDRVREAANQALLPPK